MKADRTVPEKFANKKEKITPSPAAYHPLEAWKQFEPKLKGNFKQ